MKASRAWLMTLALGFAACSKCGKPVAPAASGVEDVLPAGAAGYVIVPKVENLGQRLLLLEKLKVANFAVQPTGYETAHAYVDALVTELGIDPRSKEQLDKIGLDATRGAGVALMDQNGTPVVALPIKHPGRAAAFIQTFSANRLGASVVEDKVEQGLTVHRLMGASGPKLAWVEVQGYALIAPQQAVAQLSGWASRIPQDTLAKDTSLPSSLQRLPVERDVVVYLPPGMTSWALPVSHVVLTASLSAQQLVLSVDAPWGGDRAALEALVPKPAAALMGWLPPDAFLVVRSSMEMAGLAPVLAPFLGEHLQRAMKESGFDLAGVLTQVRPGAVLGLSLAPTAQMQAGVPELDLRRTNPFTYVHLSGAAAAKSPDAIAPTLAKLAELGPRFGAQIVARDGMYVTTYSQGEGVHFAAKGDTVLFGSPVSRLSAALASDGSAVKISDELLKPLETGAAGLVVDLHKLSDAVRELPPSAWGVGGFAIKATTVRWLDNSDDLRAVTMNLSTQGGALQGQLKLMLGHKP